MANSVVQLWNIALARVGITIRVESETERTSQALACALVYPMIRDKVLSSAPWPFATQAQSLQLTGTAPDHWDYQYAYPNDCLEVRGVYPEIPSGLAADALREWMRVYRVPFEVMAGDNDDTVICTDQEDAVILYTKRVTNVGRFSAHFDNCIAWAMAAEIAIPLAKGIDYAKNAGQQYQLALNEAFAKAMNETQPGEHPESEFVRARY